MTMIKESLDCLLMGNGWNQMAEKHTRQKTLPLVSYCFICKKIHQNIILNPRVNPCHDNSWNTAEVGIKHQSINQSINPSEPQKEFYDIEIVFLMLGAITRKHVHWSSRMCQQNMPNWCGALCFSYILTISMSGNLNTWGWLWGWNQLQWW